MHPVASVLLLLVVIIAAASIIVVAVRVTIVAIIIPRRVPSPVDCVKKRVVAFDLQSVESW